MINAKKGNKKKNTQKREKKTQEVQQTKPYSSHMEWTATNSGTNIEPITHKSGTG